MDYVHGLNTISTTWSCLYYHWLAMCKKFVNVIASSLVAASVAWNVLYPLSWEGTMWCYQMVYLYAWRVRHSHLINNVPCPQGLWSMHKCGLTTTIVMLPAWWLHSRLLGEYGHLTILKFNSDSTTSMGGDEFSNTTIQSLHCWWSGKGHHCHRNAARFIWSGAPPYDSTPKGVK